MLKTLIRPAMIFIPFLLGILFPQVHVLNKPPVNAVRLSLMIMVFMSCLQIRFSELKPRREHWLFLCVNLLMGIVPFFLLKQLCPDQPALYLAAFFVGITPTATAAPVVVAFLHGRIGFALTGFTVSNVFISLALLGLLPMVTNDFSAAFLARVVVTLFQVIVIPFAAAWLVRKIRPGAAEIPKRCKTFTFSLWSFTLFILAATARQYFIEHPHESMSTVFLIALVSLLICIANFTIGYYIARRRYKRETSQILGQKNTTFTMYLALTYASPLAALGPIFYVLWHNSWNAWQMYRCDVRQARRHR